MCTSTVAAADALPGQPATVIGDSTVERSGICTSVSLLAAHPAGLGVGLGDGVGLGLAVGVGLGDGVGVGVGLGVAVGSTVNDRVAADERFPARSIVYVENMYAPGASPLYVFGDEQLA